MTDLRVAAVDLVKRTTKAQGLPEKVQDAATLERIAAIVAGGRKRRDAA